MNFTRTLNIGPSTISPETYRDIEAFSREKIGEISHRSEEFSEISKKAADEMKKYFSIPDDYTIIWGSSATEMMELSVKSFVKKRSFHFTCGAFSERFQEISRNLGKDSQGQNAKWGELNNFDTEIPDEAEIVTITHSETSTGVVVNPAKISQIKEKLNEKQLLIIDATSIMGIEPIDISSADVWLFSVQKCFGLPAGLGVMIVNKKALKIAEKSPNLMGVLNLPAMAKKMHKNYQTIPTPNIFVIYLMGHLLSRWNEIGLVEMNRKSREKNDFLEKIIREDDKFDFFIKERSDRSESINCMTGSPESIAKLHKISRDLGLIIGGGYGSLKDKTFRLANFPNTKMSDLEKLAEILKKI